MKIDLAVPHLIWLLDHGFVHLVSYTQPVPDLISARGDSFIDYEGRDKSSWTGDLEAVRNARVSYNADWRSGKDQHKDAKLIERMMLAQHTSPFEAIHFTFEVMAPIFVFRQWHRHRTWAYNEVSARYTELPEVFYVPDPEQITGQHATDKQMRNEQQIAGANVMSELMRKHHENAFTLYRALLQSGMARELARTVLPFATYSRMFGTVSFGNLIKFLMLRIDSHAQYEIRVYAEALRKLVQPIMPHSIATFDTSFKVQQFVQKAIEKARASTDEPIDASEVLATMRDELNLLDGAPT